MLDATRDRVLANRVGHQNALLMVALVAATILLDLAFYTGFYASDDRHLITAAYHLSEGHLDFRQVASWAFSAENGPDFDFGGLRFAVTLPMALVYSLTDGSVFWLNSLFIGFHVGCVLLTYRLGLLLAGSFVGVAAAAMVAGSPLLFIFAGSILPDSATLMWSLLSAYILFDTQAKSREPDGVRTITSRLLIAGFLLGLAYSAKSTALILAVPYAALVASFSERWLSKETVKNVVILGIGIGIFIALETSFLWLLLGEPITRVQIVAGLSDTFVGKAEKQAVSPMSRFFLAHELTKASYYAWIYYGSLIAAVIYPFFSNANRYLSGILFWSLIYLVVGTTSFSNYAPPSLQPRYFSFVVPYFAIMLSSVIWWIAYPREEKRPKSEHGVLGSNVSRALVIIVIFLVGLDVAKNWDRRGRIYGSSRGRQFLAAYDYTRENYPLLSVIPSQPLRWHMHTFYLQDAMAKGVSWRDYVQELLPRQPPFLYITESLPTLTELNDLIPGVSAEDLELRVDQVVSAGHRAPLLSRTWREAFDFSIIQEAPLTEHSAAFVVEVGRNENAEEVPRALFTSENQAFPLFVTSRHTSVAIDHSRSGTEVRWGKSSQNEEPIRLLSFDRTNLRTQPEAYMAQIEPGTESIVADVTFKVLEGGRCDIQLFVGAYADGQFLGEGQSQWTAVDHTPVELRATYSDDKGRLASQYRIWINVQTPSNNSEGSLAVMDVRVARSPEPSARSTSARRTQ